MNDDLISMTHHGIMTSEADIWVHLLPFQPAVYWYTVSLCRKFIQRQKLPITFAASKDGTPRTGAGYLIRKDAFFIHRIVVPREFLASYDWVHYTDREAGLAGQDVVEALIDQELLRFPNRKTKFLTSSKEQNAGLDMRITYLDPLTLDVKTERVVSDSLFVQTHERDHRPHTGLNINDEPETRLTPFDEF